MDWPIILFRIAERLSNLGKYTFADVVSFRLGQTQIRTLSAVGTLTVVAFYLIRFGVPPALPGGPKSLTVPGVWTRARHQ